jgi:cell division GTPase FtsZ
VVIDENMQDEMRLTVIATGFKKNGKEMSSVRSAQKVAEEAEEAEADLSSEELFGLFTKKR